MNLLAIFDNDGTICDTQEVEGPCYAKAIESVTGRSLETLDWTAYEEPTSSAIVRDLLAGDPTALTKEEAVKREFVRLLEQERPKFPGDFMPLPGGVQFITRLKEDTICSVAIATGCFDTSARFKLQCCGIALDDFPHATSSDTPRRRDIIPLAARRAGFPISSVVYFGDAPWDVRVCGILVVIFVYVEDVDAAFSRAIAGGATALMAPQDQFWGDRTCRIMDPAGHVWTIATRIEDTSAEERTQRWSAILKAKG